MGNPNTRTPATNVRCLADYAPGGPRHRPARGVRVTHVRPAAATGSAGWLRISGRLADVCAELDRLVEAEAHQSAPMRRA